MLETLSWILLVQIWSDPPPKIQIVYKKEYKSYEECMIARDEWEKKKLVALCAVIAPKEHNTK